jgi:hypothetical protein
VNSYYRVAGTVFKPLRSTEIYTYTQMGCQQSSVHWVWDGTGIFQAPIQLPQGAVIKNLTVFYRNTVMSSTQHGIGEVVAYNGTGGASTLTSLVTRSVSETHNTGYFTDTSTYGGGQVVDNYNYAYAFSWLAWGPDQALCGMMLNYDRPIDTATFLPTISRQ